MINKIVVHEAVKYDNGFREQKIEIYYRFVGKIDWYKKTECQQQLALR